MAAKLIISLMVASLVAVDSQSAVLPSPACDRGYSLNQQRTACIRSQTTNTVEVCPAGSVEVAGECVIEKPKMGRFACDEGYTLDGEKCVKTYMKGARYKCEPGFILVKYKCYIVNTAPPKCRMGELVDGLCRSTHTYVPRLRCPKGAKAEGTMCRMFDADGGALQTLMPDFRCKDGWTASTTEGLCSNDLSEPPSCPRRYQLKDDKCVQYDRERPAEICDDDNDKKCIPGEIKAAAVIEGDDVSGNPPPSAKTTTGKIRSCPPGFQLQGLGQCVSNEKRTPLLRCPDGFILEEASDVATPSKCVRPAAATANAAVATAPLASSFKPNVRRVQVDY